MGGKLKYIDQTELSGNLKSIQPLTLVRVDQTKEERLWDQLMREYHYLRYQN